MRFITSIAIILCLVIGISAQSKVKKLSEPNKPTASISGIILIDGKPVPALTVELYSSKQEFSSNPPLMETKTDNNGSFNFSGLAEGTFKVIPIAPEYFITGEEISELPGKQVEVETGKSVKDLKIALARGGVITGRVTDLDGEPVIGGSVSLNVFTKLGILEAYLPTSFAAETDDRGIYRIHGVPASRYIAKAKINVLGDSKKNRESFYPDVPIEQNATIIEIDGDREKDGVDIIFKQPVSLPTFKVTGHIINAFDGTPAAKVQYNYQKINEEKVLKQGLGQNLLTNSEGNFQIRDLAPGRYIVYATPNYEKLIYSDSVSFEVTDSDINGLEIKVNRGASISGEVILKGKDDPIVLEKLKQQVFAFRITTQESDKTFKYGFRIEPDGRFTVSDLPPGNAKIFIPIFTKLFGFSIVSIERNKKEQKNGIDIQAGEQITDVRISVIHSNGSIRGQVKVPGGMLPDRTLISVCITKVGEEYNFKDCNANRYGIDRFGHFIWENLAVGDYTVELNNNSIEWPKSQDSKQVVTVVDGRVTDVTFTIKADSQEGEDEQNKNEKSDNPSIE